MVFANFCIMHIDTYWRSAKSTTEMLFGYCTTMKCGDRRAGCHPREQFAEKKMAHTSGVEIPNAPCKISMLSAVSQGNCKERVVSASLRLIGICKWRHSLVPCDRNGRYAQVSRSVERVYICRRWSGHAPPEMVQVVKKEALGPGLFNGRRAEYSGRS